MGRKQAEQGEWCQFGPGFLSVPQPPQALLAMHSISFPSPGQSGQAGLLDPCMPGHDSHSSEGWDPGTLNSKALGVGVDTGHFYRQKILLWWDGPALGITGSWHLCQEEGRGMNLESG